MFWFGFPICFVFACWLIGWLMYFGQFVNWCFVDLLVCLPVVCWCLAILVGFVMLDCFGLLFVGLCVWMFSCGCLLLFGDLGCLLIVFD